MAIKITIPQKKVNHSYFHRKSNVDVKEIELDNGKMSVTFNEAIGANRLLTKLKQTQTVIELENIPFPQLTVVKENNQINISGNAQDFSKMIQLLNQMNFISEDDKKSCDDGLSTLSSTAYKNKQ